MPANTGMQPDSAPLPPDLIEASDLLHRAAGIIGAHLQNTPPMRPVGPRWIAEAAMLAEQARDNLQAAYNVAEGDARRRAAS